MCFTSHITASNWLAPLSRDEELERRIREALRQVIDKTDKRYDLQLPEAERQERLLKAERTFFEGGLELAGELKTSLVSASFRLRVGPDISTTRVALIMAAVLVSVALVVGAVFLLAGGSGAGRK